MDGNKLRVHISVNFPLSCKLHLVQLLHNVKYYLSVTYICISVVSWYMRAHSFVFLRMHYLFISLTCTFSSLNNVV